MTLTVNLLTFKVVSESRVTWATSVPILVFLVLSVLELGPMYATDRQTDRHQTKASLNGGGGIINGHMNALLNAVVDECTRDERAGKDQGRQSGQFFWQNSLTNDPPF